MWKPTIDELNSYEDAKEDEVIGDKSLPNTLFSIGTLDCVVVSYLV
jgi:hypothetical protein